MWRVASGAKDTLRLASDFRLAALRSSIAFFSSWRLRSASSSRLRPLVLPPSFAGVLRAIGLNGSRASSVPESEVSAPFCLFGPGVEKSMRSSSAFCLLGDLPLPVLRFRSSSNVGIAFGGVSGIAGLRMDLIWNGVEIYPWSTQSIGNNLSRRILTLMAFADVSVNASRPPGPMLFPRDFFFAAARLLPCSARRAAMSVVALSLKAEALEEGMWAIDCLLLGFADRRWAFSSSISTNLNLPGHEVEGVSDLAKHNGNDVVKKPRQSTSHLEIASTLIKLTECRGSTHDLRKKHLAQSHDLGGHCQAFAHSRFWRALH